MHPFAPSQQLMPRICLICSYSSILRFDNHICAQWSWLMTPDGAWTLKPSITNSCLVLYIRWQWFAYSKHRSSRHRELNVLSTWSKWHHKYTNDRVWVNLNSESMGLAWIRFAYSLDWRFFDVGPHRVMHIITQTLLGIYSRHSLN